MAVKKTSTRKTSTRKTSTKKTNAEKTNAKKANAGKSSAKKTATKKTNTRKTNVKKASAKNKIIRAIESVRPYLITDGGDVELVSISDDLVVKVRLKGACQGCPFSEQTLRAGIEQAIRRELPELKELKAV